MERERQSELTSNCSRPLEIDPARGEFIECLDRIVKSRESCGLAGSDRGLLEAVDGSGVGIVGAESHRIDRCMELTFAFDLLDERWDSLLQCSSDLIAVADTVGTVLYLNRVPAGMTKRRTELIGLSLCDLLVPEDRAPFRASLEQVLQSGQVQCQVVSCLGDDNTVSRRKARIGRITGSRGIAAIGVFFSDIAAQEEIEAKLSDRESLLQSIVRSVPKMMNILEEAMCQNRADQELDTYELRMLHEQVMQIGRLIAVGKANASFNDRLPQLLTVVNMSIGNALAGLRDVSCPKEAVQDLNNVLKTASGIADHLELARGFGRTAVSQDWVHRVDIGAIASRVVHLLEREARVANVSITLEGMDRLPPVRMAEGDTEQLLFALIWGTIHSGDAKTHRVIAVSGVVNHRYVEVGFFGDGFGVEQERPDEVLSGRAFAGASGDVDDVDFHVAEDIVARAGGRIVIDGWMRGNPGLVIALPIVDNTLGVVGQ